MAIEDAEPGDIYADANGKLWRILSVVREPTIEAEEVEGALNDPNAPQLPTAAQGMGQALANFQGMLRASIVKAKKIAPTGSHVWFAFDRVYRRPRAAVT